MLGGVCAGIARAFGWDVVTLRIVWALSVLLFGAGLLLYLVLFVLMPAGDSGRRGALPDELRR